MPANARYGTCLGKGFEAGEGEFEDILEATFHDFFEIVPGFV